ncbi:MAG TPA: RNase adapter RapZ [Burkholderiales bacterium]|nr:RNase adapter RapZ [Burkholderiales bacterium]
MQVVLLSGLSGSGKSVALKLLEDSGYYCVDNLPVKLLEETVRLLTEENLQRVAISVDARGVGSVNSIPEFIAGLRQRGVDARLIFLDAKSETLLKRFAETRRRHPLATGESTLEESLERERGLLAPLAEAGHRIDTSDVQANTLRTWIKELLGVGSGLTSLLFESFGFKQGIPLDADFVFDVRCLPNPYYDLHLRPQTGRDPDVIAFLKSETAAEELIGDIQQFIGRWLPSFRRDNRAYLTVAIGCTGGQHRSVYCVERLAELFKSENPVLVRHRQLP